MEWVLLTIVQSQEEAIVIGSILASAGIVFKDVKESIGKTYNITMDGLGETKIYVDGTGEKYPSTALPATPASSTYHQGTPPRGFAGALYLGIFDQSLKMHFSPLPDKADLEDAKEILDSVEK